MWCLSGVALSCLHTSENSPIYLHAYSQNDNSYVLVHGFQNITIDERPIQKGVSINTRYLRQKLRLFVDLPIKIIQISTHFVHFTN